MSATTAQTPAAPADRNQEIQTFLSGTSFAGGMLTPLRIDTSVRRYYRVTKGDMVAVLMDARPPLENTDVFEFMDHKLTQMGFSVPEIYAADHKNGFVLMEDYGDDRYFELIRNNKVPFDTLMDLAVDFLIEKAKADPQLALEGSVSYSDDYWMMRVEQFLIHYIPAHPEIQMSEDAISDFKSIFRHLITSAHHFPPVLLHGDFGAQNLFYLPGRPGIKALGVIDFQDLTDARGNMSGSPAFDLVFFLQDVRMSYPDGMENRLKQRFITGAGITNIPAFDTEYAIIGAAQAVKCLGLFGRLGYRDGRSEYLDFIPYCWRNVRENLKNPALAALKTWFEQNIPEFTRSI